MANDTDLYLPLVAGTELVRRSGSLTRYPPGLILGNLSKPVGEGNPALIPGLLLWLDAADRKTISLAGTKVFQWRDKSGQSKHARQLLNARMPTYKPTGWSAALPSISLTADA